MFAKAAASDHSVDNSAAKLNHGANVGSFLDTASCDYRQESFLTSRLSLETKGHVKSRYDHRFL